MEKINDKELDRVVLKLKNNPNSLSTGKGNLAKWLKTSPEYIDMARAIIRRESVKIDTNTNPFKQLGIELVQIPPLVAKPIKGNWLIIPDLHIPFEDKYALQFIKELRKKYNTLNTIFLGDILDMHFSSFHEISTRAKGADEELELARAAVKEWYRAFPNAFVCTSNHGDLPLRKAEYAGLSSQWIKTPSEVLNTPNWLYKTYWEFDNFIVTHGTDGKNMRGKLLKYNPNKSLIQGHFHTETSLEYVNNKVWLMQLGALIDTDAYAFEYAKNNSKATIKSAAVIVNGVPIIELM
jgi:hypothetical protein